MDGFATNKKCQCLATTSAVIPPRLFQKIEILPPGAYCRKIEILWVMMFCFYTLQSQTWGNVHGGVGISSVLTNLSALENTLHYLHSCPRSSQTNVTYSPDKYCCIIVINLFQFFRITKKDNKTVCINPEAQWINNIISKVMRR